VDLSTLVNALLGYKRIPCVLAAAASLIFATACVRPSRPVDTQAADRKAIADDQAQWLADFHSRDVEKIVSHYSDDAVVIDRGEPPAKGPQEAKKLYTEAAADPASSLDFAPLEIAIAASGDIGYVRGFYKAVNTVPNTGKTAEEKGTYISIYKKQANGRWKVAVDIGSAETPAPRQNAGQ
jgi:ketosteroid isomerase-like protein